MEANFVCHGCGKRKSGVCHGHTWQKPKHWYEYKDGDGTLVACSRVCVATISKDTGKTSKIGNVERREISYTHG